ncbi:MAG: hypothetical protein E7205_02875 [Tissierellaceae bacterium]|jgi:hypothetical protein|nr:hypothetical protein [Tissierellaceae bacterium]
MRSHKKLFIKLFLLFIVIINICIIGALNTKSNPVKISDVITNTEPDPVRAEVIFSDTEPDPVRS